ncbi:MAG: hypothetical protein JKY52_08485 [Flavobacteriales bacterium]|nr:hypothetical protein [Flavobacteriales bacterium]
MSVIKRIADCVLTILNFKPPVEALTEPPEADDVMGGYWGNAIYWDKCDMESNVYNVHGFKPFDQMPEVGWFIEAAMKTSTVWFRITSIEGCRDPHDMFFANVVPVWQEMNT